MINQLKVSNMSKFTSKDLMYAMGLAVGDVIENEYGLLVKIIETDKGEIKIERDDMPVKHKLIELVDKDFEIKNKTLRMTPDERSILRTFSEAGYTVITRDNDGVWLFEQEPILQNLSSKKEVIYTSSGGNLSTVPNGLFMFINKLEKLYIDDLLKE